MVLSFISAAAAAVAFGVASLLQEHGARRSPGRRDVGVRLLADLLRQPAFVAGTALDAAGFVLTFLALRNLPLFAVEATASSAIAVTAVGCAWRGDRLGGAARGAVAAVVVGLALVAVGALPEPPPSLPGSGRLALLVGVPALAALGCAAGRRLPAGTAAPVLGGLAGLAFALFSVASRVMGPGYLTDPLGWAAVAYVALGVLLYGAALQRGPVTSVAAATTAVETVLPAVVGLALAEGARAGLGPVAAVGYLMTTVAALILIRSPAGAPERPQPTAEPAVCDLLPSSPAISAPLLTG